VDVAQADGPGHPGPPGSSRDAGDRFEINHHAYRLRQSACFSQNPEALACITCHDPHRRIPAAEKVEHYRRACLTCHSEESCSRPLPHLDPTPESARDCAGCHMPRRRAEDVVHVVVTDHRIGREIGGADLVEPRAETDPVLLDAWLLEPATVDPAARSLYRAAAVARTGASAEALAALERQLASLAAPGYEPLLDLGKGLLDRGDARRAEEVLGRLLQRFPTATHPARAWLALALARQGRLDEAISAFEATLAGDPAQPVALVNLARLQLRKGDLAAAEDPGARGAGIAPQPGARLAHRRRGGRATRRQSGRGGGLPHRHRLGAARTRRLRPPGGPATRRGPAGRGRALAGVVSRCERFDSLSLPARVCATVTAEWRTDSHHTPAAPVRSGEGRVSCRHSWLYPAAHGTAALQAPVPLLSKPSLKSGGVRP
jgi:tetratricopeptide (TPR) repeat protein